MWVKTKLKQLLLLQQFCMFLAKVKLGKNNLDKAVNCKQRIRQGISLHFEELLAKASVEERHLLRNSISLAEHLAEFWLEFYTCLQYQCNAITIFARLKQLCKVDRVIFV